jgi:hypothetical protein
MLSVSNRYLIFDIITAESMHDIEYIRNKIFERVLYYGRIKY